MRLWLPKKQEGCSLGLYRSHCLYQIWMREILASLLVNICSHTFTKSPLSIYQEWSPCFNHIFTICFENSTYSLLSQTTQRTNRVVLWERKLHQSSVYVVTFSFTQIKSVLQSAGIGSHMLLFFTRHIDPPGLTYILCRLCVHVNTASGRRQVHSLAAVFVCIEAVNLVADLWTCVFSRAGCVPLML